MKRDFETGVVPASKS